jgi:hypothetical protein
MNDQNEKQLGLLEGTAIAQVAKALAQLSTQVQTVEQELEEHRAGGRSQGLIAELDGGNRVDTAADL